MTVTYDPAAVTDRLREAGRRSDLTTGRRLEATTDYSAAAVTRRLRRVSDLRDLCRNLAAIGRAGGSD